MDRATVPGIDVISSRFLNNGRREIVYRDRQRDVRIGRFFRSEYGPEVIHAVLGALKAVGNDLVLVPDRLDETGPSTFLMSMPFGEPDRPAVSGRAIAELLAPVMGLHEAGWLHMDLSPSSFVLNHGELMLVCWGDVPASGECAPGALAAGLPPDPLDDIRSLARMLLGPAHSPWDGDSVEFVRKLASARRSQVLSGITSIAERPSRSVYPPPDSEKAPAFGTVVSINGGNWRERDALILSLAESAHDTGAVVRCIRCRPDQHGRPLPDRFPPGDCRVASVSSLMDRLFPPMGGVRRLLVVNDSEQASPDLMEILKDLSRHIPGDLAMVLASSMAVEGPEPDIEMSLTGETTAAADVRLVDLVDRFPGYGYPFLSPSGLGYRLDRVLAPPAASMLNPEVLLAEGAFRHLLAEYRADPSDRMQRIAAECSLELGLYRDALNLAPEDDRLLRARASLELGDTEAAESLMRGSREIGEAGTLLLAEAMAASGKLDGAADILSGMPGTGPALLLARVLDLLGRAAEALPVIRKAERDADQGEMVTLQCEESNILMRVGDYPGALKAAESAVRSAESLGDSSLLAAGLRERGRVREVLGRWNDALNDYRLSKSCGGVSGSMGDQVSLVDQYVLELRTGDLRSAKMTWDALRSMGAGPGAVGKQMLEMLDAYRGVLLGLGSLSLGAARRAVAIAAEHGLHLRHALSLLYLGQLQAQANLHDEALDTLNGSRARAGFLGDRHLMLLADLALASIGAVTDITRLVIEADDLGLRMEGLEARILAGGHPRDAEEALGELMEMPAPLKVLELASSALPRVGSEVRERLDSVFASIRNGLDGEEREAFAGSNARFSGVSSEPDETLQGREAALQVITGWISGRSGGATLEDLARGLGLASLSQVPTGRAGEEPISGSPELYASGKSLRSARSLGPLIAELAEMMPIRPRSGGIPNGDPFPEIVGSSATVVELKTCMEKTAALNVPVLIIGETGTGKELVARGLHRRSINPGGPFIAVDCGAIAPGLLESELFGAAKGAFTDSRVDRKGLMEVSDGGTLFLDEIGNLTPTLQAKLLRVLETGTLRRLGDTMERRVNFRLVCATNQDPADGSGDGGIRPDLYYRIAVVVLMLPPLRERSEDIPLLAAHFATAMFPGEKSSFSGGAMRRLTGYGWPGNIRELRNVVQRALIFREDSTVSEGDLVLGGSLELTGGEATTIEECVISHVLRVFRRCGENAVRAAEILGCDPKTVRKYVRLGRDGEP